MNIGRHTRAPRRRVRNDVRGEECHKIVQGATILKKNFFTYNLANGM